MPDLSGMRFSQSHEWVRVNGDSATVGITEYAQSQLGDVIYLELPNVGQNLEQGGRLGVIESVKAASDLYSPVAGQVREVNQTLKEHPEYVNQDPYDKGWIIKLGGVKDNPALLDQKAYDAFVQGSVGTVTYIPNADAERAEMLAALELKTVDGLFNHLPESLRISRVELPEPLSEVELVQYFRELGRLNVRIPPSHSFLGAGASRRFSPAIVNQVISRPDFYTTYTPYQAEASQGTLQATYEFQSMITLLTGLDVANASLYDGATSLAEAAAMAVAHTSRQNVVVAGALHPEYAQVLETYAQAQHYEILRVPNGPDGRVDSAKLEQAVTATTAAVILQQPNFYGVLEDPQPISDLAHRQGALLIASVDPISLGLLAAPGDYGADLAVGDGQPLGIPLSFGGPYVGFIACKEALVRRLPGRLVGATVDDEGRRGYVLTLQAREQHIRREHASSNITTNHALMALAATVYLAHMGGAGLKQLAELSAQRAHDLAAGLSERKGYRLAFSGPFLWEFVVRTPYPAEQTQAFMLERGVLPGLPLGRFFPELSDALLISVTELNHPPALQRFLEVLP